MALFTNIRVNPLKKPAGSIVGNGKVEIGGLDITFKVVNGSKGTFVGWPSREYTNAQGEKKYANDVWFLDKDFQNEVATAIIAEFQKQGSGDSGETLVNNHQPSKSKQAPF